MRILAIISTRNEERFIEGCIEHLVAHGLEVYLCDNGSTDRTVELAAPWLGAGVRGIEHLPHDGTFRWRRLLERKEEVAQEQPADWYLHLDADEVPLPPSSRGTLAEALAEVEARGYNAVEFAELTFVPTREAPDHDHAEFRSTMRWYYAFAPRELHLVRAWKRGAGRVELSASGGHVVSFPDRRISPERFLLRHYLFLSREHAALKYGGRGYDPDEVRDGWHSWRPTLDARTLRLPPQDELRTARSDDELDPSRPRREHCVLWTDS
jgi:glycosyltransferase involved in cell wall biosynthesis